MSTSFSRVPTLLVLCLFAAAQWACSGGEDTRAAYGGGEDPAAAVASRKPVSFTGDPGLILGTWLDESEHAELGMRFESETTFTAPDRFVTLGRVVSLATGTERELELSGTWAIKGGLLTTRLQASNHPIFPVGSSSSRRIDVLNEQELVYTEGGRELRLLRKPGQPGPSPHGSQSASNSGE